MKAIISFSLLISNLDMFKHAFLTANPSNTSLKSYISIASSIAIPVTIVPFLGTFIARPSISNCLKASLTGVLLTPILDAIIFSTNLSPCFNLFSNIAFLSSCNTISLIGLEPVPSTFVNILSPHRTIIH